MIEQKETCKDHELRLRDLEKKIAGLDLVYKVLLSVTGASLVMEGLIFLAVILH